LDLLTLSHELNAKKGRMSPLEKEKVLWDEEKLTGVRIVKDQRQEKKTKTPTKYSHHWGG